MGESRAQGMAGGGGWDTIRSSDRHQHLGVLKDQFRCSPHTIQVAIGPSAGVCCYEVDQPVLLELQNIGMVRESIVEQKTFDRGLLNLKHLNRVQAIEAGVPASNIYVFGFDR